MKIVSWNVNGLRKFKPLEKLFGELDADIICFQETRMSGLYDIQLESLAFVKGYDSFFSICRQKRGYSGVATFCKKGVATPIDAWEGLGSGAGGIEVAFKDGYCGSCDIPECSCEGKGCPLDALVGILEEGRCVITEHKRFVLINVYVPAVSVEGRITFKMHFLHALQAKVQALQASGKRVIIVGDFNICPQLIDCAEPIPKSLISEWEKRPSRQWLRRLLTSEYCQMVDSFREMHPNAKEAYSCWSEATRARENNHGVRIDLIVMNRDLFTEDVETAAVHSDISGSDHCPVSVVLRFPLLAQDIPDGPPKFCTSYMPRFAYRQQTLKDMFAQRAIAEEPEEKASSCQSASINRLGSGNRSGNLPLSLGLTREKKAIKKKPTRRKQGTLSSFVVRKPKETQEQEMALETARNASIKQSVEKETRFSPPTHRPSDQKRKESAQAWRKLLSGPPPPPLCKHGLPCVLKTVGKSGENRGRTFFSCPNPEGIGKQANCNFFQWAPFRAGMYIK